MSAAPSPHYTPWQDGFDPDADLLGERAVQGAKILLRVYMKRLATARGELEHAEADAIAAATRLAEARETVIRAAEQLEEAAGLFARVADLAGHVPRGGARVLEGWHRAVAAAAEWRARRKVRS